MFGDFKSKEAAREFVESAIRYFDEYGASPLEVILPGGIGMFLPEAPLNNLSSEKVAISYQQLLRNTPPQIPARPVSGGMPSIITWKRDKATGDAWSMMRYRFKGLPKPTSGRVSTGYIKLLKPDRIVVKRGVKNVDCAVWCSCPYFTYWLEYVLTKTVTPPASEIANSNGAAPQVLNTEHNPHLCKHLCNANNFLRAFNDAIKPSEDFEQKMYKKDIPKKVPKKPGERDIAPP